MGTDFDSIDASIETGNYLRGIPLKFWDSWLDERNHSFRGFYKGIEKSDWPELAEIIATSIENNIPIQEPRILNAFGIDPKSNKKAQALLFLLCYSGYIVSFFLFAHAITDYIPKAHVSAMEQYVSFWASIALFLPTFAAAIVFGKRLGRTKFILLNLPGTLIFSCFAYLIYIRL
jgi:multidrug transporter EmrE-like cation transporter